MRAKATNFKLADLPSVVEYAHERGVKVHLACNVAVHAGEMNELADYLKAAQAAGVDALIIGDLGAAALARELAPDVDIHVSTQANITSAKADRIFKLLRSACRREEFHGHRVLPFLGQRVGEGG